MKMHNVVYYKGAEAVNKKKKKKEKEIGKKAKA